MAVFICLLVVYHKSHEDRPTGDGPDLTRTEVPRETAHINIENVKRRL